MDRDEARELVERSVARFPAAGLPPLEATAITEVKSKAIASLWAGMGAVYSLSITHSAGGPPIEIIAKKVQLPKKCTSMGDQRKKDSYDVEAAFYSHGHAERLIASNALVPFPLHVEKSPCEDVTICMTQLDGSSQSRGQPETFVVWLARLHATYWGPRADVACGPACGGGLALQGCYWHLDTRPDEHARMGTSGWMGRLKLAARAIDLRLKADLLQTICHGDAKGANIMYSHGEDGVAVPLVYDFQYCGKGAATKDLAYFLNVDVYATNADEERILQLYHSELSDLLMAQGDVVPSFEILRTSFELALCDWRRFSEIGLGGWGDQSANGRVQKLLERLDGGKKLQSEEAYIEAMTREFPV
eukprot:TRINITY_DN57106_c0_g1_i1.p1 TRINITY_DN57106_c0_g1~~TRINITY_DN57106_c0_g1_i1.p1  ORF type:complete len:361 (+),score=56.13 TRINITY_DN57106_c0_g1_i1:94-1176(+)